MTASKEMCPNECRQVNSRWVAHTIDSILGWRRYEEEVQPLFADVVGEQVAVASSGPELAAGRQPARASRGRLEQTSRDRLFLQLAKLPQRFHAEAAGAFGGRSLPALGLLRERLIFKGHFMLLKTPYMATC